MRLAETGSGLTDRVPYVLRASVHYVPYRQNIPKRAPKEVGFKADRAPRVLTYHKGIPVDGKDKRSSTYTTFAFRSMARKIAGQSSFILTPFEQLARRGTSSKTMAALLVPRHASSWLFYFFFCARTRRPTRSHNKADVYYVRVAKGTSPSVPNRLRVVRQSRSDRGSRSPLRPRPREAPRGPGVVVEVLGAPEDGRGIFLSFVGRVGVPQQRRSISERLGRALLDPPRVCTQRSILVLTARERESRPTGQAGRQATA